MADWIPVLDLLVASRPGDVDTTQQHPLGSVRFFRDKATTAYGMGEFIYLKGLAATAVGTVVTYNSDDFSTTLAVANGVGPVAVACAATVASTWGWYQISGKGAAAVLTGFLDNADCYLTATPGSVDDTDVAGDYVRGMVGASAVGTPSAGLAEVELFRPQVADGKDN